MPWSGVSLYYEKVLHIEQRHIIWDNRDVLGCPWRQLPPKEITPIGKKVWMMMRKATSLMWAGVAEQSEQRKMTLKSG